MEQNLVLGIKRIRFHRVDPDAPDGPVFDDAQHCADQVGAPQNAAVRSPQPEFRANHRELLASPFLLRGHGEGREVRGKQRYENS
jgi:hypothetical protein